MHKIVLNNCYGGFSLSESALKRYEEISGNPFPGRMRVSRHDPFLVRVVEELKAAANGRNASLGVEEIPGNRYYITEYDGVEELHYPESEGWIVIE